MWTYDKEGAVTGLVCDGYLPDFKRCAESVTRINSRKGWVYCETHGVSGVDRKLKPAELRKLLRGEAI